MDKWNAQYNLYTMHQKAYVRDGKPVYGNVIELNFLIIKGRLRQISNLANIVVLVGRVVRGLSWGKRNIRIYALIVTKPN